MKNEIRPATGQVCTPKERDLVIAYLSYAMDDVRMLNSTAFYLLQMTIESLANESASVDGVQSILSKLQH